MAHWLIQPSSNTGPPIATRLARHKPWMEQGAPQGLLTDCSVRRVCQTASLETSGTYCAQDARSGAARRPGGGCVCDTQKQSQCEGVLAEGARGVTRGGGSQRDVGTEAQASPALSESRRGRRAAEPAGRRSSSSGVPRGAPLPSASALQPSPEGGVSAGGNCQEQSQAGERPRQGLCGVHVKAGGWRGRRVRGHLSPRLLPTVTPTHGHTR